MDVITTEVKRGKGRPRKYASDTERLNAYKDQDYKRKYYEANREILLKKGRDKYIKEHGGEYKYKTVYSNSSIEQTD